MKDIDWIIEQIWQELDHQRKPAFIITPEIHQKLVKQDIRQLLIRFFLTHGSSWNEEFLFLTYDYWKDLERSDWEMIFTGIKGNNLGEYYMATLAARYLGVHVEYESTKDVVVTSYSCETIESGKPSIFIGDSKGGHLDFHKRIFEAYDLKVEDFLLLKQKLHTDQPIILYTKAEEPQTMIGKIYGRLKSIIKKLS